MIIGIDPGFKGGVAALNGRDLLFGRRMPVIKDGTREMIDTHRLAQMLAGDAEVKKQYVIESVHSMPKQGVASTFKFGRAAGAVEGLAMMLSDSVTFVSPQKWKRAMGVTSDKRSSLKMAGELWPYAEIKWNILRNDGIAEAALLALYAHEHLKVGYHGTTG